MSDINDDLLNYELGELDDNVLAADEDELLQSDDESSPTKLSQQEEALLLDDEELLNCPQNDSNISRCPEEVSKPLDSIHIGEFRDDLVTTTTPEPTTSTISLNEVEATPASENDFTYGSSRNPLKRISDTTKSRKSEDDALSAVVDPKKLRVDAPEFVPGSVTDAELFDREDENSEEVFAARIDSMSYVSTSSTFDALPEDEIESSQKTSLYTTDTSVGLCLTEDDELEHESTDDAEHLPTETSQPIRKHYVEESTEGSSTGMDESDYEFSTSRSSRKPGAALLALPEFETEDSDEGNERLNPKHHVERDSADDQFNKTAHSASSHFQNRNQNHRGGHRGGSNFPGNSDRRPNNYRFPSQLQFNPNFTNQYRPTANERGPSLLMNPHTPPLVGNITPLLQFRSLLPPQSIYRPIYNDGGRPRMGGPPALMSRQQRPPQMQRPSFGPQHANQQPSFRSTSPFSHPSMRPQHQQQPHNMPPRFDHHQSRMMPGPSSQQQQHVGPPQFMPQRLMQPMSYGVASGIGHGGGGGAMPPMGHGPVPRGGAPPLNNLAPAPPVIPRKVLINPNFKGGVEAATKLMATPNSITN